MRAWALHSTYSVIKIFLWTSGQSIWLSDVESCEAAQSSLVGRELEVEAPLDPPEDGDQCVPFDFREDLVENFKSPIKYISMVMVILSCILDIAIYKKRNLVDLILYMELLHLTFLTTIPSPNNNYTDLYIILGHYIMLTVFYTNTGGQIIISLLSQAV